MYGLILENIVAHLKKQYGPKIWQEIKYVGGKWEYATTILAAFFREILSSSGIEQDTFKMDEVFSEGLVHKIIWSAQGRLNMFF